MTFISSSEMKKIFYEPSLKNLLTRIQLMMRSFYIWISRNSEILRHCCYFSFLHLLFLFILHLIFLLITLGNLFW